MFDGLLGNAGVLSMEEMDKEYGQLLAEDEEFQIGFKVMRDTFLFTDRRLELVDVQGMTGRKKEFLSIPYDKITHV
ncbi:MAG: PH domain-containing protein [Chloroflexi bacterium]|nr:PH domain-containing protein [Chloroflexota bacterium]